MSKHRKEKDKLGATFEVPSIHAVEGGVLSSGEKSKVVRQIGPYFIQDEIGHGAMGAVYRATHTKLKRLVALKVLPPELMDSADRVKRFQREMEAVGRLDHPNIVRATDAGEANGVHFLTMEYVEGIDLEKILESEKKLDYASACEIVRQTALGLQHISENNLVHRDIKPSNLLLTKQGIVKILDLGIARLRSEEDDMTATSMGVMMGTPDYIAPEQIQESRDVDIRADIYSLGCSLYMLISGRPPFHGPDHDTQIAKFIAHSKEMPTVLSSLDPTIPLELAETVNKMIMKSVDDRFQTPNEVADALGKWADSSQLQRLAGASAEEIANKQCLSTIGAAQDNTNTSSDRSKSVPTKNWSTWAIVGVVAIVVLSAWVITSVNSSSITNPPTDLEETVTKMVANEQFEKPDVDSPFENGEIVSKINDVADDTMAIREHTDSLQEINTQISDHTKQIAETLSDLRETFAAATQKGGIAVNPTSAGEFYHNARTYERQGNFVAARESYMQLFQQGVDYIDVHYHFQKVLRLQEGLNRAKRTYRSLPGDDTKVERQFALALLENIDEQEKALIRIVAEYPDFAPAWFELSRCSSKEVLGQQSLMDKAREKERLERFQHLVDEGVLLQYMLDQSAAVSIVQNADKRLKALAGLDSKIFKNPVRVSCGKSSSAYDIVFRLAENAREISYRFGDEGTFTSTGFTEHTDPKSGKLAPSTVISVSLSTQPSTLYVKYVDIRGIERGPFEIDFHPDEAALEDAKRKLRSTERMWMRFRRDKLHFNFLAKYREFISEVRIGLNQDQPNESLHELPVLSKASSSPAFVQLDEDVTYVVIQLTFKDGDQSRIVRIDRQ